MEFKLKFAVPFSLLLVLVGIGCISCRLTETINQESPIICFSFDDGSDTVFHNALPLLRQYHYPATVYVNSGRIGSPNHLSVSQLQAIKEEGWELGGHSLNHEHLSQLSYEQASQAIAADYQNLVDWGLNPRSFALPYGECPHEYYPIITRYYDIIRGSSDFPLQSPIDPLRLSYTSFQSDWDITQISARITQGIINHEDLIILGFHTIDPDNTISGINCDPQTFSQIISYIESRDIRVMTVSQALAALKSSSKR